jgi:hypothetical protein
MDVISVSFPYKKAEKLPDGNSYQDYRLSPFVVPTNSVYCFNTILGNIN